jgi:hypothetical protein
VTRRRRGHSLERGLSGVVQRFEVLEHPVVLATLQPYRCIQKRRGPLSGGSTHRTPAPRSTVKQLRDVFPERVFWDRNWR